MLLLPSSALLLVLVLAGRETTVTNHTAANIERTMVVRGLRCVKEPVNARCAVAPPPCRSQLNTHGNEHEYQNQLDIRTLPLRLTLTCQTIAKPGKQKAVQEAGNSHSIHRLQDTFIRTYKKTLKSIIPD